ncbi:carbamoyltransferase HypF [Yinghuangia seranimata]|uniref:carbamoyltransferase HypF n=1 Tax=Yinghuangia seranimata TaxID=408067 RepID=UPI00248CB5A1|nr:carbamoyltransferase HypF [Yinghuangia seranimata]MDI2130502.1 carbamoyltransferase HypF [Yinghuangia seranimata]
MTGTAVARRIEVYGTVQGVGFRPFVHRLATALGLDGRVSNAGGHVVIEAGGGALELACFTERLVRDAPPAAEVTAVLTGSLVGAAPAPGSGFAVAASSDRTDLPRTVPPDLATCAACLRELFAPADRRYRYPFTNCTDCGPRATVIAALPYDRERTAMRGFPLCRRCAREYADPADRRFHAEPLACPDCGPTLAWRQDGGAAASGAAALLRAELLIAAGGIAAVKGLGGYQLVCDARDPLTVARLRRRKGRPAKPLAVMVRDLDAARRVADLTDAEAVLLADRAAPIVLVDARADTRLPAEALHPGTDRIGLMLPTTPLHHLLLADLDRPLVVTSGNRSGEPIAIDDADAAARLADVADGFLGHDRPILARYDDSVVAVQAGTGRPLRRARGLAPAPVRLPVPAPVPVLGAGAHLKHTLTLARDDFAVVGPHTGDLGDADAADSLEHSYRRLSTVHAFTPAAVAHDLHPGYLSTRWAASLPVAQRIAVQHHHAHVAACAAEHGHTGTFVGVAYDGLGLGDDGTLWGGEILVADLAGYRRVARFAAAPLPGGDAAVRHPARAALGHLLGAEPLGAPPQDPALVAVFTGGLEPTMVDRITAMLRADVRCPRASSAGRLFDTAAALLGLRHSVSYEAEAAIALETEALRDRSADRPELPWRIAEHAGLRVYDPAPTLAALLAAAAEGTPVPRVAAAFHRTLAAVTAALVEPAARAAGTRTVCLGGGCFDNRLLAREVTAALSALGLTVLAPRLLPAGDGGISYGQAAVAAARLRKEH